MRILPQFKKASNKKKVCIHFEYFEMIRSQYDIHKLETSGAKVVHLVETLIFYLNKTSVSLKCVRYC